MQDVADLAKSLVLDRTSKGFGVKRPEGNSERLKPLSESYKKERKRLSKRGKLSNQTTVGKSNLTKTRQMLNSVNAKASTAQAEVYLNNELARSKAEYQENDDRAFMNLSKNEVSKIKKLIESKLLNDIRKKGL